tara:strand:+ start:230 stop:469 length:240 start_codon:yes stop_codon:yes gene_type:complete
MKTKVLWTAFFYFIGTMISIGQGCAMCKAQLETSEDEIGNGLNNGIIYLMIIPYLLLTSILLVFFRGKIVSAFKRYISK